MGLCASAEQGDYEFINPYDGETLLCFRHGEGTYQYNNGDTYKGEWKWNQKHGHGVYTHHNNGEIKRGYFYEDKYIGPDPGDLFAATSCFTGCFVSSSAEPLASDEEIRHQKQMDAKREQLEQRAKVRKERKQQRDAMAEKYKICPKNTGNIREPKK
ncbi:hypothetical protein ACROYT_G036985 [Oculina patagonica]